MSEFLSDPFGWFGQLLQDLLLGWGLQAEAATFILQLLGALVLGTGVLLLTFLLIWAERKIVARMQDRLGPNRVGPLGLFQPLADGLKNFTKEEVIPNQADRTMFLLAPALMFMPPVKPTLPSITRILRWLRRLKY